MSTKETQNHSQIPHKNLPLTRFKSVLFKRREKEHTEERAQRMGCCVSKHDEGQKEGKENEKDKDPIKSTLNSLEEEEERKHKQHEKRNKIGFEMQTKCLLLVPIIVAVRTHPRVERRTGDDFEQ